MILREIGVEVTRGDTASDVTKFVWFCPKAREQGTAYQSAGHKRSNCHQGVEHENQNFVLTRSTGMGVSQRDQLLCQPVLKCFEFINLGGLVSPPINRIDAETAFLCLGERDTAILEGHIKHR